MNIVLGREAAVGRGSIATARPVMYLQPVVEIATGQPAAAEALARVPSAPDLSVGSVIAALFPALYANEILRFVLVGTVTIALAALSRRCLELPFIKLKDRFSTGHPGVVVVTPAG